MADIRSAQILAQVEYILFMDYTGAITFTITPESRCAPNWIHYYDGDITSTLIPGGTYFADYVYVGDVTFFIVPTAVTSAIYPYAYVGDLPLSITPESITDDAPFIPHDMSSFEGLRLSGDGEFVFYTPTEFAVEGEGGLVFSGDGEENFVLLTIFLTEAEGGMLFSGVGEVLFIAVPVLPVYTLEGTGGYEISGDGLLSFIDVAVVYTVTGFGGLFAGGSGTTVFVEAEVIEYTVEGVGGLAFSGEGVAVFTIPDIVFSLEASGGMLLNGTGSFVWLAPNYFSLVGSGGVVISGEGTEEEFIYFTWVFSGVDYKPSIYSGYNFNSYCEFGGKTYGANEIGIFELSGETDDGVGVHTGVILGPHNLGVANKKRLRAIYLGNKNTGARIKVTLDTTSKEFAVTRGKAKVTRDLMGEEVTLEIADFEDLSVIEVIPVVLGLRG